MARFTMQSAVVNHKGKIRGNNEDNFYLNGIYMERSRMDEGAAASDSCSDPFQVYAVCDGMGGTDAGEDASCFVVQELSKRRGFLRQELTPGQLTPVLREISDSIYEDAQRKGIRSGTTIAMILVEQDTAMVVNVGDSRVYRMRDGVLTQISEDHSKVQRMINMGMITREQARTDPNRHIITQYMGMPDEIRISPGYVTGMELRTGDRFLICSDGLSDMVEDSGIEDILKRNPDCTDAAKALVKAALENGGRDNVTVMVVKAAGAVRETSETTASAAGNALQPKNGGLPAGTAGGKNRKGSTLRKLLIAGQILTGIGIVAVAADLIWYFLKTRT